MTLLWNPLSVVTQVGSTDPQIAKALAEKDPIRDFVHTKTDAYLMLPPQFICGPLVQQFAWTSDGEKLVVLRTNMKMTPDFVTSAFGDHDVQQSPEPETEIYTWSAKTGKVSEVFHVKAADVLISDIQWITGSSSLVFEGIDNTDQANPISRIYVISNSGVVKTVLTEPINEDAVIYPSPSKAMVALMSREFTQKVSTGDYSAPPNITVVRFFGPDGTLTPPIKLPTARSLFRWTSDGRPFAMSFERDPKTKKADKKWYALNPSDRSFHLAEPPAEFQKSMFPEPTNVFVVEDQATTLPINIKGTVAPTVIIRPRAEKDAEYGVVTTDGRRGEVAPNSTAISFESQGNALVRPMVKVPLDAYNAARTARLRATLLSNAKQVALSLIMFAADNNDNLPQNNAGWKNAIDPYLKNQQISDGFIYTFGGGNMSKIESPATTEIGYFTGPGGRAVAYSDGHCKWIPNP